MDAAISVRADTEGAITYHVDRPPERLPVVTRRDLLAAWAAAHDAADAARWGAPRAVRFRRTDGQETVIAISDADARCWAAAVDATMGINHLYGMALCFRLLALIELMARARWLRGLYDFGRNGGVELHPSLVAAAARMPLGSDGRFDEVALKGALGRRLAGGGA